MSLLISIITLISLLYVVAAVAVGYEDLKEGRSLNFAYIVITYLSIVLFYSISNIY